MNERKTLSAGLSTGLSALLFISGIIMVGVSLYLTSHYFNINFPEGLASASACDINSFFNCDASTTSPLSNIAGVPISLFGVLIGLFVLLGMLFKNEELEGTNHFLLRLNALGCLILFVYSLAVLGSLCPFCTAYYLVSFIALYIFHKHSSLTMPTPKFGGVMVVIFAAVFAFEYSSVNEKLSNKSKYSKSLIAQFKSSKNLGVPKKESPFRLASATERFEDGPIQITVFSDFQCPACKLITHVLPILEKKYHGKLNIQYNYYPLDQACNPSIKNPFHQYACKAAYLTSCLPKNFKEIHDYIFANQDQLSDAWLDDLAKKEGVVECMKTEKTKSLVLALINNAKDFNIQSTPSLIVNGVKISGVRKLTDYETIFNQILKDQTKK